MTDGAWTTMLEDRVTEQMIDEVGHVNFLEYHRLAERATSLLWDRIVGRDAGSGESSITWALLEAHVTYRSELRLLDDYEVQVALFAYDAKRFHLLHRVRRDGADACFLESMNVCFDPVSRKVAHFPMASMSVLASLKRGGGGYEGYATGVFRRLG